MSENPNVTENTKSAEELMAEFDRESNVRQFHGIPGIIIKAL